MSLRNYAFTHSRYPRHSPRQDDDFHEQALKPIIPAPLSAPLDAHHRLSPAVLALHATAGFLDQPVAVRAGIANQPPRALPPLDHTKYPSPVLCGSSRPDNTASTRPMLSATSPRPPHLFTTLRKLRCSSVTWLGT